MQAHPSSSTAAQRFSTPRPEASLAEGPGIAHDAGNLLGALALYCDLLEKPGVLQPQHIHYAREVRLLAQRSGVLLNRLLEQCLPIPDLPFDKLQTTAAAIRAFSAVLRSVAGPGVRVSISISPQLPVLPFPTEVLERILVNLTRNAAAAVRSQGTIAAQPGHIQIAVTGNSSHLRLTVVDNGPGMSPATIASFLNPRPLKAGATRGLGHRVVHELVHSTGGSVSIAASARKRTAIQIDWMFCQEPDSASAKTKLEFQPN